MAALSIPIRSTLCSSCIRRMVGYDISQLWFPSHRQLRGKKKSAKRPTTINVKLLEDIIGFGRKGNQHSVCNSQYVLIPVFTGSICPVEPGRMRNTWYPRQKAEYMTASTLHGLKQQSLVAERDFAFGMKSNEKPAPTKKAPERERVVEVQTKLLPVRVSYCCSGPLRRLTMNAATTSFRNDRGLLAPESHILQNSHKRP